MARKQTQGIPAIEGLEARRMLTASVLPDLTIAVVSCSTGNFVGGDAGDIVVSVGNDGAELAVGTESIKVYVSADGSVGDATLITAVQETGKLSSGASVSVNIPFLFPGVEINGGRLIATVSAASQVIDSDVTNDIAVGTSPVSVALPDADLAAEDVTITGIPAAGTVAGQQAHAIVTIKNVGNVGVSGAIGVGLLLADDTAGDGAISLLSDAAVRNVNLVPGSFLDVPITFTVPNVAGSKFVLATVDSSAATLEMNLANNTVSAAQAILISPAQVSLSDQIITAPPASVVSGSVGHATVRVFNNGNVLFHGIAPISLYTSLDTTLDGGDERLLESNRNVSIAVGKFQDVGIIFSYPTDLPDDNYYLLAQIGGTATTVKGAFSSGPIAVASSDASATAGVVNISLPFVTLTPVFGTLPGTAFTAGEEVTIPLNLINSGNVLADGQYTIELLASPSVDANDSASIALTPIIARHLVLKSNTTMALAFRLKIPSTLVGGIDYFFVARLVATNVPLISNANPTAVSQQTFILTD